MAHSLRLRLKLCFPSRHTAQGCAFLLADLPNLRHTFAQDGPLHGEDLFFAQTLDLPSAMKAVRETCA